MRFCRIINFLFTFWKALSNTERPGQHESDPFTTDEPYAASVMATTKPSGHFHQKIKFSSGPSEAPVPLLRVQLNTSLDMAPTEVIMSEPGPCHRPVRRPRKIQTPSAVWSS